MTRVEHPLGHFGSFPLSRLHAVGTAGNPREAEAPAVAWSRRYRAKLLVTDLIVVSIAVALSVVVGIVDDIEVVSFGGVEASRWITGAFLALCWITALGVYHTRENRSLGVGAAEYKRVISASAITFGLLAIAFVALEVDAVRGFFLVSLPIGLLSLLAGRWLWRRWLTRQRLFGNYLSRVLVVGEPNDIRYVVHQIAKNSGAAYSVVGAAVRGKNPAPIVDGKSEIPVVANPDGAAEAAVELGADTIIVAGERVGDKTYLRDLGWQLESTGAELVVASRLTNVAGPRIHFRPVEGLPLMHVELPHYEGSKHVLKRVLDIVVSGAAMLALVPVMLAIAIAVKRDSPGPVLFTQERVGRNGDTFRILKFRTMVQSAEDDLAGLLDKNEGSGVLFKMKNDPRVTRVGKFLRAHSLDELPQLWNILIGEMSLVGPRPPLPEEVKEYEGHVHRRLYIKPGLTGMWQVNGRSDLDWEESVRLDLYYVENWSLTGDLMIIWRTFRLLMHPVGAY